MPNDSDRPVAHVPGHDAAAPLVGLHERARRVGHHVWLEQRLFEILGAWSAVTPEADVAALFGELSRRHGWHSGLFRDRLPELSSVDADALVTCPGPATERLIDEVADDVDPARTLEHLVAMHRVVVPLVLTQYRAELASASPVADASLSRWLRFVVDDDLDEWARGEAAIRALVVDAASVERCAKEQLRLELLAVATASLSH